MSRCRLILLLAAVVFGAAACEVHTEVAVDVEENGSGTVTVTATLDGEAARRLGDPATALRVDDLVGAGWTLEELESVDGGGVVLVGRRSFEAPEQLAGVLDEVGGVDGVFSGTELTVTDGFASTTYDFGTEVELTGSLEQFSDPDLAAALGGLPLARSPEELAVEGATVPEAATLDVVVSLPGGEPETNGELDGETAEWSFSASSGEPTSESLVSTSSVSAGTTRTLVLVAVVAVLAAAALAAVGVLRRRA